MGRCSIIFTTATSVFKGDWGVSVNGEVEGGEYEIALTRGVGNEWRRHGDPFVMAGRVGTARDADWVFGLSALYAEIYQYANPDDTFRRARVAVDFITGCDEFTFLGELHIGRDESMNVVNSLFEIDMRSDDDTHLFFLQFVSFSSDFAAGWDSNIFSNFGIRWTPDTHWSFSTQWTQDLRAFEGQETVGTIAMQARYRF